MVHNIDCRPPGSILNPSNRSSYVLNIKIQDVEKADLVLLIGTNPRWEAPIINAKIRQAWLKNRCPIFFVGEQTMNLTYPVKKIGSAATDVEKILGRSFIDRFKKSKNPLMLVGSRVAARSDAATLFHILEEVLDKGEFIRKGWRGYGMIPNSSRASWRPPR